MSLQLFNLGITGRATALRYATIDDAGTTLTSWTNSGAITELAPGSVSTGIYKVDIATTGVFAVLWRDTTSGEEGFSVEKIAAASGTGAYTITATVTDGTDPLQNAIVRVTEGANTFTATTDASGNAVFALDAATYSVAITKAGYQFTPTTRTVTGAELGTLASADLVMSEITIPAAPADGTLCRTYGYFEGLDNRAAEGLVFKIDLMVPGSVAAKSNKTLRKTLTVRTDTSGMIQDAAGNDYVDLQRTDELTPAGCTYRITCAEIGWKNKSFTTAATTLNLATLVT